MAPGAITRRLMIVTAGLLLLNTVALIDLANRLGALRTSLKWQSAILGSLLIGVGLAAILAWARGGRAGLFGRLEVWLLRLGPSLGRLRLALFVLLLPILPILTMLLAVKAFEPLSLRVLSGWLLAILGGLLLSDGRGGTAFLLRLAFSGVALGVVFQVAGYLPEISTYPLSLGWSETSRYYNASLFFAERVYGQSAPLPVLHPSRYLMQSLPFLFGMLPLGVHRLWQVLLWLGVTLGFSATLARRIGVQSTLGRAALAGACYLFLMQGPVYYHLLVGAWMVLAWASSRRPWRTLLVVVLASAWAGISRVNWMPVPALLAIVIYLLESPLGDLRSRITAYVAWPAAYAAAGALAALAANRAYAAFSGNPIAEFGSSFTSGLLWYRLLPSATYPLGVLPAILIASALPIWLLMSRRRSQATSLPLLRRLGLAAAPAVLFLGGLVVSAKIGGGGNLHNLDAYLVVLLVITVFWTFGPVTTEAGTPMGGPTPSLALLGATLAVPVAFALSVHGAWPMRETDSARALVERVSQAATNAGRQGQRVLFISERHLIAFQGLEVRLEPDYEKVYLMEMAMAGNRDYLDRFYADLASHRFGLIVTERLSTGLQGSEYTFGEENDVWAQRVAAPILANYTVQEELGSLWLMTPR
jgi:hypothetical protein